MSRNRAWGRIIGEPSKLLEKAKAGSLALYGIHVEVVKDIKCEGSLGADKTG